MCDRASSAPDLLACSKISFLTMTLSDISTSTVFVSAVDSPDQQEHHQHVSSDGIKIKFKVLPYQTSQTAITPPRRRKVEFAQQRDRRATTETTSSSSSSENIIEDHSHQNPVAARVFPATATTAKDSLTASQRPEQCTSCLASSQRQTLSLSKCPKHSETSEHDSLLLGHESCQTGLSGCHDLGRVSQQKTVAPEGLSRLRGELAKLKAPEEGLEDVLSLVHALLPAVECDRDCAAGRC